MSNWTRARSDEQINLRINTILEAAAKVFKEVPYEKVTMMMIAKEAQFTRSNLYRYFKSRDEIFLALFINDLTIFKNEVLKTFTKELKINEFANTWTKILVSHKRFLELSPLFATSLEKNSSKEIIKESKIIINKYVDELCLCIEKVLPNITIKDAYKFMVLHQSLVAGLYPMTILTPLIEEAIEELGFEDRKVEFETFYYETILNYLKGINQG